MTTYRWRALDSGDYIFCLKGQTDRYQPYVWSGLYAVESSGPTDAARDAARTRGDVRLAGVRISFELSLHFRLSRALEPVLRRNDGALLAAAAAGRIGDRRDEQAIALAASAVLAQRMTRFYWFFVC